MSRFSGKCDLWDSLVTIRGVDDKIDWSKIQIYQATSESKFDAVQGFTGDRLLSIRSLKDLIPYAPYLVNIAIFSNDASYVRICDKSFVDTEEARHLTYILDYFKRRYRSCRRKKEEYNPEVEAKRYDDSYEPELTLQIAKRVKEHPTSANIDGLHLFMSEYYRNKLIDAMKEYGYTDKEAKSWVRGEIE